MKQPQKREQNKKSNRQTILAAARQVFDEIGFEAANVRDIIRKTPFASGTFYNYFKTKEQVFLALHEDAIKEFRPELRLAFEAAKGDFGNFLELAFLNYFNFKLKATKRIAKSEKIIANHTPMRTPQEAAISDEIKNYINEFSNQDFLKHIDSELLTRSCIGIAQELGILIEQDTKFTPQYCAKFAAEIIQKGVLSSKLHGVDQSI